MSEDQILSYKSGIPTYVNKIVDSNLPSPVGTLDVTNLSCDNLTVQIGGSSGSAGEYLQKSDPGNVLTWGSLPSNPVTYFNRGGTVTTPVFSNIKYYHAYGTTSTGSITFNITTDGTGGGSAVFSSLSTSFIQTTAQRDTTSNTEVPFTAVRSITGNTVIINVKTGNSGTIVIGGSYTGMKDNSNSVTVYISVFGE